MNLEHLGPLVTSIGVGSIAGFAIGYAIKKVFKIGLSVLGLFFAAVVYLQPQGVVNVNWDKVEVISRSAATAVSNISIDGQGTESIIANLGLPLTGSMAMGIAVGFMRG